MKLLVLGGTLFLGRHIVATALARRHEVTTFTRGRTNPTLFPDVEALHGDRNADLSALRGRTWDGVVDTSAYVPRQAADAAVALGNRVGRYCLISTASVYASFPADENTATHLPLDDQAPGQPETYGPLKRGCERAILESLGDRAVVVRPGVLAGPYDPTGRLGYWVHRIAAGGEVLAPGDPAHPVQLLDARDLAAWLLTLLENGASGIFNASGPPTPLTMGALLETCRTAAAADVRFTWVDDAFLIGEKVTPWSDLPLWLPAAMFGPILDSERAYRAGLTCRALGDTVRDMSVDDAHVHSVVGGPTRPLPITRDRERELLQRWRDARNAAARRHPTNA